VAQSMRGGLWRLLDSRQKIRIPAPARNCSSYTRN
jgi:hypothetical protein